MVLVDFAGCILVDAAEQPPFIFEDSGDTSKRLRESFRMHSKEMLERALP